MPDIRPLRAWRYDLGRVGALSDVVAPPYDVIDSALQQALYDRHPNNVVRLILNREETADNAQQNRYSRAARCLKDWQFEGILRQDTQPNLYLCHQIFQVDGHSHTRRGILARVRLEKFGEGNIYAHEETMPGPKADRLKLMHATAMNLSPIFGLYPDPANEIQNRVDAAVGRALPLEATDHLGTVSRLWPISQLEVVGEIQRLFFPKPVFIADGHHRYETSLKYREEKSAVGEVADPEAPPNFTLMMLVGMSDPGLIIQPTHRLVSGLPPLTAEQLGSVLKSHWTLEPMGHGPAGARETWERIELEGEQSLLGFGTVADGVWQLGRFRAPEMMQKLASGHSVEWQKLGVSILHVAVLDNLLKEGLKCLPNCKYVHRLDEVTHAVESKECQLAVLVPPAEMKHVERIAGNLEKMPPKSTYFHPKLLSGLVLNPVK